MLCSKDADRPGAREIRDAVHGCDREKLLDECEGRSDAVVVVRIEREIGWCKLWDCGRNRGPKCIAGLRALVRILTYPAHAMNCCPKCDVDRLGEGMTLLAHVIEKHTSARFTSIILCLRITHQNPLSVSNFLLMCCYFCVYVYWAVDSKPLNLGYFNDTVPHDDPVPNEPHPLSSQKSKQTT